MRKFVCMLAALLLSTAAVSAAADNDVAPDRALSFSISSSSSGVEVGYLKFDSPHTAWVGILGLGGRCYVSPLGSDNPQYCSYSGNLSLGIQRLWYLFPDVTARPFVGVGARLYGRYYLNDYSDKSVILNSSNSSYQASLQTLAGVEFRLTERVAITTRYNLNVSYYLDIQRTNYREDEDQSYYHHSVNLEFNGLYAGLTFYLE